MRRLFILSIIICVHLIKAYSVVGDVESNTQVSNSGAAIHSISIECPKGVRGMEPTVSITYNSQIGNGNLGKGWSVSATSVISKACPNIYYNSFVGGINIEKSGEYLTLDGQRLVFNGYKNDSKTKVEFRTENDNLDKIIMEGSNGDFRFTVYARDGRTLKYSQLKEGSDYFDGNAGWFLTECTDLYGNYITYDYHVEATKTKPYNIESVKLASISYGGNKNTGAKHTCVVLFFYGEVASLPHLTYVDGFAKDNTYIISEIRTISLGNNQYRKYKMNYSEINHTKVLTKIQVYGNNDTDKYPDIDIAWNQGEGLSQNTESINNILINKIIDPKNSIWNAVDFNHDGLTDLVCLTSIGNKNYFYFFKAVLNNRKVNFVLLSDPLHIDEWYDDINILRKNTGFIRGNFSSMNRESFIVPYFIKGGKVRFLYFTYKEGQMKLSQYEIESKNNPETVFPIYACADLDKDGFDDIVLLRRNTDYSHGKKHFSLYIWYGGDKPGQRQQLIEIPTGYGSPRSMYLSDLNADGLIDIQVLTTQTNIAIKNMSKPRNYIDTDRNFQVITWGYNPYSSVVVGGNTLGLSGNEFILSSVPGDYNGDGIIDFHIIDKAHNSYCAMGNGNFDYNIDVYSWKLNNLDFNDEPGIVKNMDLNGDGRNDIITCRYDYTWESIFCDELNNDNAKINKIERLKADKWLSGADRLGTVIEGDFNGDGAMDLLFAGQANGREYDGFSLRSGVLSQGLTVNEIKSFSKSVRFEYSTLADKTVYTNTNKSYGNNITILSAPMQIVKSITLNNIKTSYRYKDALSETTGKGFLGFVETEISKEFENSKGKYTLTSKTTKELVNVPFTFVLNNKYFSNPSVMLIDKIIESPEAIIQYDYTFKRFGYKDRGVITQLQKTTELNKLTNVKKITTYENYNKYNVPAKITEQIGDYYTITEIPYFKTLDSHSMCLPYHKKTTLITPKGTYQRLDVFSYNDNMDSYHVHEYSGTDKQLSTRRLYDERGNLIKKLVYARGIENVETNYEYSSTGRFLKKVSNSDGYQTLYNYDEGLCRLIWKHEIAGNGEISLITRYEEYDGFNNCTKLLLPDGRTQKNIMGFVNSDVYYAKTELAGTPSLVSYYNRFGQLIKTEDKGLDKKTRKTEYQYDKYNMLREKRSGFAESSYSELNLDEAYEYDQHGRILTYKDRIGETTYKYGKNYTIVTSPMVKKKMIYNVIGQLTACTENGKSVFYDYDPLGNMISATPQDGKTITMEYDIAGNRTKLSDPDVGVIEWEYDNLGREISKLDHNMSSQPITRNYNSRGCLLSITAEGYQVRFGYNAANQLVNEHTKQGYTAEYKYDRQGRITHKKEWIKDKILNTYYEYDKLYGSATKITYPSGIFVENKYDDNGYLSKVTVSNGKYKNNVWEKKFVKYDKDGNVTEDKVTTRDEITSRYTNTGERIKDPVSAFVKKYEYDNAGRLTREACNTIRLSDLEFRAMDMSYEYDKYFVSKKTDNRLNQTEVYTYDELNRLSKVDINRRTVSGIEKNRNGVFSYDALSNITQNYEGTEMQYEGKAPHQATGADFKHYAPAAEQKVAFTSFRMIDNISQGNYSYDVTYGTDQRKRMTVLKKDGKTIKKKYYTTDYELTVNSLGKSTETHYICGGNGLAAILVRTGGKDSLHYVMTDRQGSMMASVLTAVDGEMTADQAITRYSYDCYGHRRSCAGWDLTTQDVRSKFDRGFCMHEHLSEFGLIDMDGRVYNPYLNQFISPDPHIQDPTRWLNFNRYAYGLQNPVMYNDPTGEFWHIVIGAAIGGVANWATHGCQFNGRGLGYFAVGAVAGAATAAVGAGIGACMSGTGSFAAGVVGEASTTATGFVAGAQIGAATGMMSGNILGFGNALIGGGSFIDAVQGGGIGGFTGVFSGILVGGISSGIAAVCKGKTFWEGDPYAKTKVSQMTQEGPTDCRYECFKANDIKRNGSTKSVAELRKEFPNAETNTKSMGRMYASKRMAVGEITKESAENGAIKTKAEIAKEIIKEMKKGNTVNMEFNVNSVTENGVTQINRHSVVIKYIRVCESTGDISIKVMNPSGVGGTTFTDFSKVQNIFTISNF